MSSENDNCKLCKTSAKLRKSHIIPEFIYKPLYDKNIHRFHSFSSKINYRPKYLQKGVWDRLLCDDCEQKFGRYEKYANDNFFNNPNIEAVQVADLLIVKNLNYSQFKLFQLSILWRMSVTIKIGFDAFTLGPNEEIIRKMLFIENPGNIDEFGCLLYYMADPDVNLNGLIISPEFFTKNGYKVLRVVFGGFTWVYFISRTIENLDYRDHFITRKGDLKILLRIARNMKFVQGHAKNI